MAERRADVSILIIDEEFKMIIRELVIYKDNKRSIRFTKSFGRPAKNKYSLQAGSTATTKS